MSIESMIENLTNTIKELVTVIGEQNNLIRTQLQPQAIPIVTKTAGLTDHVAVIANAQPSFMVQDASSAEPAKPAAKKTSKPKPVEIPVDLAEDAPTYTIADVQSTIVSLVTKVNRDTAVGILEKYNAKNVSGLDPAVYPQVMAEALARLAQVPDPLAA